MKSFSTMIEIFITIVLLYIVPFYYFTCQEELILSNFVEYETTYFIDSVRNVGYIDQGMYELYNQKLIRTGHSYTVQIAHYQNYRTREQGSYLRGTYHEKIMSVIYDQSEKYIMHQGDMVSIEVVRKDQTFGERLMHKLGISVKLSAPIKYGGMIRDECF